MGDGNPRKFDVIVTVVDTSPGGFDLIVTGLENYGLEITGFIPKEAQASGG